MAVGQTIKPGSIEDTNGAIYAFPARADIYALSESVVILAFIGWLLELGHAIQLNPPETWVFPWS